MNIKLQSQVPNPLCSPIAWLPPCSQGLLLSGKPTPIHSLPARPNKWPKQKDVLRKKISTSSENIIKQNLFRSLFRFLVFWLKNTKSLPKTIQQLHENLQAWCLNRSATSKGQLATWKRGKTRIYTSELQGELSHLGAWEFQDCEFSVANFLSNDLRCIWDILVRPILQLW